MTEGYYICIPYALYEIIELKIEYIYEKCSMVDQHGKWNWEEEILAQQTEVQPTPLFLNLRSISVISLKVLLMLVYHSRTWWSSLVRFISYHFIYCLLTLNILSVFHPLPRSWSSLFLYLLFFSFLRFFFGFVGWNYESEFCHKLFVFHQEIIVWLRTIMFSHNRFFFLFERHNRYFVKLVIILFKGIGSHHIIKEMHLFKTKLKRKLYLWMSFLIQYLQEAYSAHMRFLKVKVQN